MTAAQRFVPGECVVGKYRLRRVLATGGMGQVWLARNEATGADVALKVLRRSDLDADTERQFEERFRQEARLSAMLAHRSIVRVFDLVEQESGLVLVMELLRGETLHDYLQRLGPRSCDEAVAILAPILGALAHAHDLGLLHRDVSPANIFLAVDPDGHVAPKLVDFGIAKARAGVSSSPVETAFGDVLGTPRYVAPERIRGASDVDGRADLFSVGVVLYELLTAVSPFAATSASASLASVLERTVDPDPAIDPRLWLELRRALSKQPYERHANARELAASLREALGASEGALEARLQAITPRVTAEPEDGAADAPLVLDRSFAAVLPRARRPSSWLVVGATLVLLTAGAAFALTRGTRHFSAAPAPPQDPPASLGTGAPRPQPALTIASPGASVSPAAIAPSAPHPRPASRPRPVATTPGF